MPRQGTNARGKQNTQFEVSLLLLPVNVIVKKLEDALVKCRLHQTNYKWKNLMRTRDLTMSNPDKYRIICTDFGATLNLRGKMVDNSPVDNHAVVAIFFVISGWRRTKYKVTNIETNVEEDDETIICDCDKWAFFGDTLSKGKKNDHVFHEACITYINNFYDRKRAAEGKVPIRIKVLPQGS